MPTLPHRSLLSRLAEVRLFLCDVDGVLTDGRVLCGQGQEYKAFHVADDLGQVLLQRNGIRVGWVSHRPSEATAQHAQALGIDFLHQEPTSKVEAVERILNSTGLTWDNVCYVGDDLLDLGALKRAGFAVAVANAVEEVKAAAHYVTQAAGGTGAVREAAQLVLEAQQRWSDLIEQFGG